MFGFDLAVEHILHYVFIPLAYFTWKYMSVSFNFGAGMIGMNHYTEDTSDGLIDADRI